MLLGFYLFANQLIFAQKQLKYYANFSFGIDLASAVMVTFNPHTESSILKDDPGLGKVSLGLGRCFRELNLRIEGGGCLFLNKTTKQYNYVNLASKSVTLEVSNYAPGFYIKPVLFFLLIDEDGKKGELSWNWYCHMNVYRSYSSLSYNTWSNQQGGNNLEQIARVENKGNFNVSLEPGTSFLYNFSDTYKASLWFSWATVNFSSSVQQFKFGNVQLHTNLHRVHNLIAGFNLMFAF